MSINNNIGKNLFAAMQYAKAENKNKKGDLKLDKNADESLKSLDLNNDGKVSKSEIQKSLFDANGDKKISSEDLGIYTAFISLAGKLEGKKDTELTNKDFDIDGNGKLDSNEKLLKSLFDEDMLELISDDNGIDKNLIELLNNEEEVLNKKINPELNDGTTRKNRVFDTVTGKLLSQDITKNGVEYKQEYKYTEGTNKIAESKLINKSTGIAATNNYEYDKDGRLLKVTYTRPVKGEMQTTTYDYTYNKDGSYKKEAENLTTGKKTTYKYNANNQLKSKEVTTEPKSKETYEYNKDGSPLRTYTYIYNKDGSYTKSGINHNTGKTTVYTYGADNQLKSKEVTSFPKSLEIYNEKGQLTSKETIKENGDKTTVNYLRYYTNEKGQECKDYTVEYDYVNGIHTKSYI